MIQNQKDVTGFVKTEGTKIINGDGKEIILRGVGFGSWMLPEGYMWCFPQQGDRPRRMEKMIVDLIGEEKSTRFWEIYYENYISKPDIQRIAEEGFNSVRVPIHYRFLMEEGHSRYNEQHLIILDRVIDWCRDFRLYVILDLHGAPGGQTGTNIDDSENDVPELFTNENNKQQTVSLWRMLAKRYKNEWIIAGYDLLNEPLPNWFSLYNDQVMPLYREIIQAIREVDDQHMIILEGVHWATDWSIFNEKIDDNVMLQFHKYWNNPDTESIQAFLDQREKLNVPIYMGEGGENNKDWYTGAFRLYEDHDISWNFWTWKKMDTQNSPCSIKKPNGWDLFVSYLEGGPKPDTLTSERILWEYLNNVRFENCDYHMDVVNALLRRPPVRIPAIFYGYRGEGISYVIKESRSSIEFRESDGTDIQFINSIRTEPTFEHGGGEEWKSDERLSLVIYPDEKFVYEIFVPKTLSTGQFNLELHLKGLSSSGYVMVDVNHKQLGTMETAVESWGICKLPRPFRLHSGLNSIVLRGAMSPIQVDWLEIKPVETN